MAAQEPIMDARATEITTSYGSVGGAQNSANVVVVPVKPDDEQALLSTSNDVKQAEVVVVKWDKYKVPLPLDHKVFMRKVLYCLCAQLAVTTAVIAVCIYVTTLRDWLVENYWMYIVGIVASICELCHLMHIIDVYPTNVVWLGIWTITMAYTIATLCAAYATLFGANMIMQALGITILIFLILALFSLQTKINLYPLGLVAFMLFNAVLWWGLWAAIFGWYTSSAWSLMFIVIFCMLILFDIWRMANMPVFDPNAWIAAAINLYLDIINLFLWMLSFLASKR